MTKVSYFLVAVSFAASWPSEADSTDRSAYIKVYTQHVNERSSLMAKAFEQKGLSPEQARIEADEFIDKGIRCHVKALDLYPQEITAALYDTVRTGGSYPDAESALKKVVGEAQLDGNNEVMKAFITATGASLSCLKGGIVEQ